MSEVLRQEKKYLLSYDQFRRLDHQFMQVLHPDSHNGMNGYAVRSLYFDTLQERDFYEKEETAAWRCAEKYALGPMTPMPPSPCWR